MSRSNLFKIHHRTSNFPIFIFHIFLLQTSTIKNPFETHSRETKKEETPRAAVHRRHSNELKVRPEENHHLEWRFQQTTHSAEHQWVREKNYVVTLGGEMEQAMVVTEKERKSKRWDVNKSILGWWTLRLGGMLNVADDRRQFEKLRWLKGLKLWWREDFVDLEKKILNLFLNFLTFLIFVEFFSIWRLLTS